MKKTLPLLILFLAGTLQLWAQKKKLMPEMKFPKDLPDSLHHILYKQYELGFKLYTLNCSRCHSPGEKEIPRFTDSQLANYQMRTSKGHVGKLSDRQVPDAELSLILTFLQNIKRKEE